MSIKKRISLYFLLIGFSYFLINSFRIYIYSTNYTEEYSDVAIVLGAGTSNGKISPVFRERVNHGIYLIKNERAKYLILTGGIGSDQSVADSEVAKKYAINLGVSKSQILIESKSNYTIENLIHAKQLMNSVDAETALIVSDPLHMKRAMLLCGELNINASSSPTQTSMYRTYNSKSRSLFYETFYFTIREVKSIF